MDDNPQGTLPTSGEILLERSLYERLPLTKGDADTLTTLFRENFQIDAFCIKCKKESIFKTARTTGGGSGGNSLVDFAALFIPARRTVTIICQRCAQEYQFFFSQVPGSIEKIGQYSSLEDINSSDINKFRGLLKNEDFKELKRAGGLFSHGVGIGAFVYLRRIFERLIWSHFDELKTKGEEPADFDRMRMSEKIGALSAVLPPALVANRRAYGILSKGIHELDEDTCRKFFPAVRRAIIQILDQDLTAREIEKDAKALENELAAIADLIDRNDEEQA